MKRNVLFILLLNHFVTHAQNVGIGTSTPSRAKLEVNGVVGSTSAIFGGDGSGISLQRNWPGIGFNQYYNGGSKFIGHGYAAVQFVDQNNGSMVFETFGYGSPDYDAGSGRRVMVLSPLGRVNVGSGSLPNSIFNVARDPLSIPAATASFEGSNHHSHFNYSGTEDTYIRAGKNNGTVYINDIPGGKIALSGFVGINTATPAAPLEIRQNGSQTGIVLVNGNTFTNWGFRVETSLYVNYNGVAVGRFWSDGEYTTVSDRRLKTNVRPIRSVLDKVMQLEPVSYEMINNNTDHKQSIGFLAQHVKNILPELVSVGSDSLSGYKGINDLHMVNYSNFSVVAIKAIQEQQVIINKQEQAIQAMRKEIDELKSRK